MEATLPETLPWLCSTCHLPCSNATQSRNGTWRVRNWELDYDGHTYHFCTNACRQIFWKDRDNVNHETLVDRFLAGQYPAHGRRRHPRLHGHDPRRDG